MHPNSLDRQVYLILNVTFSLINFFLQLSGRAEDCSVQTATYLQVRCSNHLRDFDPTSSIKCWINIFELFSSVWDWKAWRMCMQRVFCLAGLLFILFLRRWIFKSGRSQAGKRAPSGGMLQAKQTQLNEASLPEQWSQQVPHGRPLRKPVSLQDELIFIRSVRPLVRDGNGHR